MTELSLMDMDPLGSLQFYGGVPNNPNTPNPNGDVTASVSPQGLGNANLSTYPTVNQSSWQPSPIHSPVPVQQQHQQHQQLQHQHQSQQQQPAHNGLHYQMGYQNQNIQTPGYTNSLPYNQLGFNQNGVPQRHSPYAVPIDPALVRTDSRPLTSGSPGISYGNPGILPGGTPASTVSPHALQTRLQPYHNPTLQGQSSGSYNASSNTQQSSSRPARTFPEKTIENFPQHYPSVNVPAPAPNRHPTNISSALRPSSVSSQPIQPQPHKAFEAVLSPQSQGPPAKPAADLPKVPASIVNGKVRVIEPNTLAKSTASKPVSTFMTVSQDAYSLDIVKAAIPKFVQRRSRNELEKMFKEGKISSLPGLKKKKKEKPSKPRDARVILKPGRPTSTDSPNTMVSLSGSSSGSESEYESDYESDPGNEEDDVEPSPLPPKRPEDPLGRVKYDTIKVVWSPRNRAPAAQDIRAAIVSYSELLKGYRDEWKASVAKLQEAEKNKDPSAIRKCKIPVNQGRQYLETSLKALLENGHPAIVEKLGGNPHTSLVFNSFLLDRYQEGDLDGSLNVHILKAMSKFTTLSEELLERTKINRMLARLVKKGGEEVKSLAQKVLNNAAEHNKPTSGSAKSTSAVASPPITSTIKAEEGVSISAKPEKPPGNSSAIRRENQTRSSPVKRSVPEPVSGAKRLRETGGSDLPAQKRVVAPSGAKTAPEDQGKARTVIKRIVPSNTGLKTSTSSSSTAAAALAKQKAVTTPTPKTTISVFSSLSSASKKPGTSNAALAAANKQKASHPAKENTPINAGHDRTTSPPPRPTFSLSETLANLSEPKQSAKAEKASNMPAESEEDRRKRLRKESRRHLRVSFRPDESLTEIRLFTHDPEEEPNAEGGGMRDVGDLRSEGQALKMHMDRQLDDDDTGNAEMFEWHTPSPIDFSNIPQAEREKSYIKCGGLLEPTSPHKAEEDARQAKILMVFYTYSTDIPPSPREPAADEEFEPAEPETPFGEPGDEFRQREARVDAMRLANQDANRYSIQDTPQNTSHPPNSNSLANILAKIQQPQQPSFQAMVQQSQQFPSQDSLAQILGKINQPSQQVQLQNPASSAAIGATDLSKILASFNSSNPPQQQQQHQAVQPQNAPNTSIQDIIAGFQKQLAQQQQTGSFGSGYAGDYGSNKRRFEDRIDGAEKRQKKWDPNYKRGTVVCKYWKEGSCKRGADCTFRHSD